LDGFLDRAVHVSWCSVHPWFLCFNCHIFREETGRQV
jgi:hypothetical protein